MLDKSHGGYEVTVARKPHSIHSDQNRTPKFVGEILAMINNNPSKSFRSIAVNMGVSKFLIRQVVHEEIQYFSYKMWKEPIFITDLEGQQERPHWKAFQQIEASSLVEQDLIFLRWEKFLPRSDDELTEQLLACFVPTGCTDINEN